MTLELPEDFVRVTESAGQVETCIRVNGALSVPVAAVITTSDGTARGNRYVSEVSHYNYSFRKWFI